MSVDFRRRGVIPAGEWLAVYTGLSVEILIGSATPSLVRIVVWPSRKE